MTRPTAATIELAEGAVDVARQRRERSVLVPGRYRHLERRAGARPVARGLDLDRAESGLPEHETERRNGPLAPALDEHERGPRAGA